MISRVADSCFWLFRYIERAESCARLASVNRLLVMDAGSGQYMQLIQYEKGQSPSLTITAAGATSERIRAVPRGKGGPYRTLTYVFGLLFVLTLIALVMQRRRAGTMRG